MAEVCLPYEINLQHLKLVLDDDFFSGVSKTLRLKLVLSEWKVSISVEIGTNHQYQGKKGKRFRLNLPKLMGF